MLLMGRANEITVLRAAGVSPLKLVIPLAFSGLILSLFHFWLANSIIPQNAKYKELPILFHDISGN